MLAWNVSADVPVCHTGCPQTLFSKMNAMPQRPTTVKLPGGHALAWRERGPANAPAWLVLHGGPGSGGNPGLWAALDARRQRAVMPDQRGSGASTPRGSLRGQGVARHVADMEALRVHLGVARWPVLAGSWGTVLALAYAQAHPDRVAALVLRGAFALTRAEIANVLVPAPRWVKTLGGGAASLVLGSRLVLPAVLAQRVRLLQSGTVAVASLRACRAWGAMESVLAAHGQWRALRHAPGNAAARRAWAGTRRGLRRALARASRPRADRRDRAAWGKFRIQARVLQRRAGLRAGALDRAVMAIARSGVAVHWLHGHFDAVCPPHNSRRWAAMGVTQGGAVRFTPVPAGHLAGEPAMAAALRQAVRP